MQQVLDILKVAHRGGIEPSMDLLIEKKQAIPGSINYHIRRYFAQHPWVADDAGMMIYHFNEKKPQENYLELRYCTTGNKYCYDKSCSFCEKQPTNCMGNKSPLMFLLFIFQQPS